MATVGLLIAILATAIAWLQVSALRETFWLEVGKAAMSALVFGFFGVLVGAFIRSGEIEREELRQLLDHRRKVLEEAAIAFGRVRKARRSLRALGFGRRNVTERALSFTGPSEQPISLTTGQLLGLDQQIDVITDAQLTFDGLRRGVESRPGAFSRSKGLLTSLTEIDRYLRAVIEDWEMNRSSLSESSHLDKVAEWPAFHPFLALGAEQASSFLVARKAMDQVSEAILADLLPSTSAGMGAPRR